MRELNGHERSRRFYGDTLTATRKSGRYGRTAPPDELVADLAVVRAIADATEGRRTFYAVLMGVVVLLALLIAGSMQRDQAAPLILMLPVLFVLSMFRRFTRPWDRRRIELAAGLLRSIALAPGSDVKLTVDLRRTQQRKFKVDSPGVATRYVIPWLDLDATLTDGTRLAVKRHEQCDYTYRVSGRTHIHTWYFEFEDQVELRFASARAPIDPALRDALKLPENFSLRGFEATADRAKLTVASTLRWDAWPTPPAKADALDAVDLTLKWVELLGTLTQQPPPRRAQPAEPARASCWVVGPRGIGWLLLLLSGPPAAGLVYSVSMVQERLELGSDLSSIGQAGEAAFFGGITLLIWVGVGLLWKLPRSRARKPVSQAAAL